MYAEIFKTRATLLQTTDEQCTGQFYTDLDFFHIEVTVTRSVIRDVMKWRLLESTHYLP